jgi:Asp-tRNA(Asn)/Glu-tRNA(Gln) amidotransferase A subunit family amidase
MKVPDFRHITVEDLAGHVRAGDLTAVAVTEAALERIEKLNPVLNAFVAVDADDALAQARAVDVRIQAGEDVGPLAGIPIGVKDLEDAKGFVTSHGSALRAGNPPATEDSTQVARLRRRCCIVIGNRSRQRLTLVESPEPFDSLEFRHGQDRYLPSSLAS